MIHYGTQKGFVKLAKINQLMSISRHVNRQTSSFKCCSHAKVVIKLNIWKVSTFYEGFYDIVRSFGHDFSALMGNDIETRRDVVGRNELTAGWFFFSLFSINQRIFFLDLFISIAYIHRFFLFCRKKSWKYRRNWRFDWNLKGYNSTTQHSQSRK